LGIDLEEEYLKISVNRKLEIENPAIEKQFKKRLIFL
jgi:hypothetical protein